MFSHSEQKKFILTEGRSKPVPPPRSHSLETFGKKFDDDEGEEEVEEEEETKVVTTEAVSSPTTETTRSKSSSITETTRSKSFDSFGEHSLTSLLSIHFTQEVRIVSSIV